MQFAANNYEYVDFSNQIMEMEDISKKKFTGCKFRHADFSDVPAIYGCTFDTCDFAGARLNGVDIKHSAFLSCLFNGASFFGTRLESCKMTGSDLSGCHFNQCKMNNCEFDEAIVHDTSFYKSDIRGSTMERLNLFEVSFRQAKLDISQCVTIAEHLTEGKYSPDEKE
jgi:fluoroquinolone resistance protein